MEMENQDKKLLEDLQKVIDRSARLFERYAQDVETTLGNIKKLEQLGYDNATLVMRDGKYAVMVYPMVDGVRKRTYIGNDPARIEDAKARIARWAAWEAENNTLDNLYYQQRRYRNLIQEFSTRMKKTPGYPEHLP